MKKVTFILNDGPVAMRSWNALRLAGGMLDVNVAVEIVLFDDAVLCAKKEQNPPEGLEGQKTGRYPGRTGRAWGENMGMRHLHESQRNRRSGID